MDNNLLVQIRRSGGVTGISRTGKLHLALPSHGTQDDYWYQLALEVRKELRTSPQESTASLTRDAFFWSLSFDTENFVVPDSELSEDTKKLIAHVLEVTSVQPPEPRFGDQ